MLVEIFINEERLDTDVETKIAETKQVNDFFEISNVQTSYTNIFKLPKTSRNIMLLGGMGIPANTSITAYRIHKVNVYRDGIQTIQNGIGYFNPTNNHFNMYVYNDNVSLFDVIGDKPLADLNLTSLNHDLNIESWLSSFNRDDYIYAVADYGKVDTDIEINYQIPGLFVKYLWNKIFNEAGFNWEYYGRGGRNDFNPFLKDEWNQLAITIDEGFPSSDESINAIKKLELSVDKTSQYQGETITYFGMYVVVQKLTGLITEYIRFSSVFNEEGIHTFSSSAQYNRSRIRIKESGFYKITATGNFYNHNTENAGLYIEKDGYNLFTINDDFPSNQTVLGFSNKIYLRQGDELFVKIVTSPINNESHYSYDINFQLWLDNTVTSVNFSSYLSKIKQKDFIKDVMHHYGLMAINKAGLYQFRCFDELLDPLASYVNYDANAENTVYDDWSDKFHRVLEDDSKIGNYAKNNYFKYRYDNPESTFADGIIKVDDQTLENEIILIQRPYKAPENSTTRISSNTLKRCTFYEKEYNEDGSIKSIKHAKTSPYFFKVEYKTTAITYKLKDAEGSSSFAGKIPFMSFDGLDFNNILPNRYTAFANMVNYGQKITAEMFLTVLDIHVLDFFRLKYIKLLGSLYYVNKPVKFTGKGPTKVELIRIRSIEKLGEFSDDFSADFNI